MTAENVGKMEIYFVLKIEPGTTCVYSCLMSCVPTYTTPLPVPRTLSPTLSLSPLHDRRQLPTVVAVVAVVARGQWVLGVVGWCLGKVQRRNVQLVETSTPKQVKRMP